MPEVFQRTAYTLVRRASNACRTVLHDAEVASLADGRTQELLPGTTTDVLLMDMPYRLVVLDASHTTDSPCGMKQEGHVSFGLYRTR